MQKCIFLFLHLRTVKFLKITTMKILFKIMGFFFLQFAAFAMFMSATQGGKKTLIILPIACVLGLLSYFILFGKTKKNSI